MMHQVCALLGSVALFGLTLSASMPGYADEIERDTCRCKSVQVGATSSLKGGVCVRTETGSCLMEWGAGGKGTALQGNGMSQEEAAAKARTLIISTKKVALEIPRMAPSPDSSDLLAVAIGNLARVPPSDYGKNGMLESFVLASGTALARFDGIQLGAFAANMLNEQRAALLNAVQKGGGLKFEGFEVQGSEGCMAVRHFATPEVQVFVVTPFANARRC